MRRMMLTLAFLAAVCATGHADENKELAKKLKDARAAMKKIAFFTGRWGAIETHPPSPYVPKGGKFRAKETVKQLYKGLHLQVEHTSYLRAKYEATGVWSFDIDRQEYVLSWFDSDGGYDQYRGKLSEDGKDLTLGRQKGEANYTLHYRIHDPHHYTFTMTIKKGEQSQVVLTSEFTRNGKGPRMVEFVCHCGKKKLKPLGSKAPS